MKEIIQEHKQNIIKIFKLARVDLIKTYRGAHLGWIWAIIKPIFTIFVYWFTLAIGLRVSRDINGYPYFFWLIAGVIPWFYISEMITSGAGSLRKYSYIVTKMKFPISIIPTIVNTSKFFVHIILIIIMVGIFGWSGYQVDGYILQLLFYMALSFVFLEAWALLSACLSAISRDFFNFVRSINTAIFWLSGIVWDVTKLKVSWVRKILWFNPVTYLINGYRNCFIYKIYFWEQPKQLMAFLISVMIVNIMGVFVFKKLKKDILDLL